MRRARFGMALAALLLTAGASALAQTAGTALAPGQTIAGEISTNDAQRQSGKYEDVFIVQGRRGARIDLRLSSAQFDPYLVVTGPDANLPADYAVLGKVTEGIENVKAMEALASTEELDYTEALDWFGLRFAGAGGEQPMRMWRLEVRPDATEEQKTRLQTWLGQAGK